MHWRPIPRLRPRVERLEEKRLQSAIGLSSHEVEQKAGAGASAFHRFDATNAQGADRDGASNHAAHKRHSQSGPSGEHDGAVHADHRRLPAIPTAFLGHRITNPMVHKVGLSPPFGQVLVQARQPVPGQVYNLLYVAVKNATAQTFTASSGFTVRLTGGNFFPVLTGAQQWKPRQWIVFYILTKKYYPLAQVYGGFELLLGGRLTTLVPGPSAIFLRLKYNPATFTRTLDWIVAFGQGAQLGLGPPVGLPDTAINQILAGRTHKIDFGGHF
jgi:hypothetical protein